MTGQLQNAGYVPSAWGQTFHSLTHNEALGAGAAGPGKTEVLLHDPLAQIFTEHQRCVDRTHPHRHARMGDSTGWAIHLRRTTKMLEQTVQRFLRVYPRIDPGLVWEVSKLTATFSSGYRYQFAHCKDPYDYENYMSYEFTYIAFDELTQFEEEQYDQITTRLRSTDPVLSSMMKVRAMSNPMMRRGEVGDTFSVSNPHWVRDRFVKPAPEGRVTLKRKITHPDGEVEYRTFIYLPATIDDNPNKAFVKQYRAALLAQKPHIQQALLYGNWYVTPDSFYADVWNPTIHVCQPFKVPSDWRVFRSMDWGYKKPGCVLWFAMDHEGTLYVIRQMMFIGKLDVEIARAIYEVEDEMGYWVQGRSALTGPADTQLWEERGDSGKTKSATMAEHGVSWTKADKKSRQTNAERITARLKDHVGGTMTPGLVIFSTCRNLIETLPSIQTDPDFTEVPQDGGDDHAHDALCYAVAYASHGTAGVAKKREKRPEWYDEDEKDAVVAPKRGRSGYGT